MLRTVIRILDAELDPTPLDCEDRSRVHVWVFALAWDPRRAFVTSGDCLMEFMGWAPEDYSPANVASLVGLRFMAEFDAPAHIPELGERVELRNISFPLSPPANWFSGFGVEEA